MFVDTRAISTEEQGEELWEGTRLPQLRAARANAPQNAISVHASESSLSILLISLAAATEI